MVTKITYWRFDQLWREEGEDLTERLQLIKKLERGGFLRLISYVANGEVKGN